METEREEYTPRPYQTELAELAKKKNTIIFLPTGSGKTFIAVLVIKHFLSLETRRFSEGAKRCFFVVNTVLLVEQQADVLERHLPIRKTGRYHGKMNCDYSKDKIWHEAFEKHETLVMTADIFKAALKYISPNQIAVVVFDECHRAVGDSPMHEAARLILCQRSEHKPRLVGLSAILLNANVKSLQDAELNVAELLRTFDAVLGSVSDVGVLFFSTRPKERVIKYGKVIAQGPRIGAALRALELAKRYSGIFGGPERSSKATIEKLKKVKKEVTNLLVDIEIHFESLGLYGGSKVALWVLKMFESMKRDESGNISVFVQITHAVNAVTIVYDSLTKEMAAWEKNIRALECSSPKVRALIHLLVDVQERAKKEDFRCLILVERKLTAKMVCTVLNQIARIPKYSFIKAAFMVGNSGSPNPFPGVEEGFDKMDRRAIKDFGSGEVNVLVSTDVTEEGIDIPLCNCVVKFDKILSYRSYMQSKGRARSRDSFYYVMESVEEVTSTVLKLAEYSRIHAHFANIVSETETDADTLSQAHVVREEPETYETQRATLRDVSAIPIIYKYVSLFNYDQYTIESPEWEIIKVFAEDGKLCQYVAELKLPQSVPFKLCVRSKVKTNSKLAKRNAAFLMCIELHKLGELNDNLMPVAPEARFEPDPSWWPHSNITERLEKKMKGDRLGTKQQEQLYFTKVPNCLTNCSPNQGQEAYLHVLDIKPTVRPSDRQYGFIFDRVKEDGSFGLLTTTQMPKVCPFPAYSRIGELGVDFIPNYSKVILTNDELTILESFARIFFCFMIPCVVPSEARLTNSGKNYFVVPTKTDSCGITIDWTAMEHSLRLREIDKPSDEERLTIEVRNETYLGAVVGRWYRGSDKTILIVTQIEHHMNAMSKFPNSNCTFNERYVTEYKVGTLRPDLPLLEAKALSTCYNGLRKRINSVVSHSSKQHFIADLMNVLPLSCTLWVKAIMLPTILCRLERLLIAEEVRSTIALENSLGYVIPPADFMWQRLEEESENRERLCMHTREDVHVNDKVPEEQVPSLRPLRSEANLEGLQQNEDPTNKIDFYDQVPKVEVLFPRLLRSEANTEGLQQSKVLTALTAPSANDLVNYERMETLGDAFLKVVVSLFVYEACPLKSEGMLTNLKSRFIGNRNLFNCALNKKIPEVMVTRNLPLPEGWLPPKFVPSATNIVHKKMGRNDEIDDIVVKFSSVSLKEKPSFVPVYALTALEMTNGTHLISDKAVADCVEALLGASLLDCGWNGALDVLMWFEILPKTIKKQNKEVRLKMLLQNGYFEPISLSTNLLPREVDEVQSLLRYTFKQPNILLQALTHPSHDAQNSYERLEFIGDAVLDFLITSYIFENCGLLSPGKLTDLRSALVNNVTFAALTAKYGLNRFLLMNSPVLMQVIDSFIISQKKSNHRIDSDLLILCDDAELKISDQITVPKSLADLFEALAGAVFFDCGRDLKTVWSVFYPLMHPVIEAFRKDIPIDPVRKLYETFTKDRLVFEYNKDEINNRMIATCIVQSASEEYQFHGYGENRKMAKKAVAKFALYSLKKNGVSELP